MHAVLPDGAVDTIVSSQAFWMHAVLHPRTSGCTLSMHAVLPDAAVDIIVSSYMHAVLPDPQ